MDFATVGGIALGFGGLIMGILIEGAALKSFFGISALIIIFFGTFGATMVSFSLKQLKELPRIVKHAFIQKEFDAAGVIATLVSFAEKARREGLLVLEDDAQKLDDKFLQKGIQLVVDGTDMELVRSIMNTELSFLETRHKVGENMFMTLGGFAPTLGIIGTVMGLVFVLQKGVEDPEAAVHGIATAFLATLYGICSANLIFIPIANKLKLKSQEEVLLREIMIEGILSIQAGDNPRIVEEKLKAFLPPAQREGVKPGGEKAGAGRAAGEAVGAR